MTSTEDNTKVPSLVIPTRDGAASEVDANSSLGFTLFSPRVSEGRLFVHVVSCSGLDLTLDCAGYYCVMMVEKQSSRTATVEAASLVAQPPLDAKQLDKIQQQDKHNLGVVEWGQMFNFDFTQEEASFSCHVWARGTRQNPEPTHIGEVFLNVSELETGVVTKSFEIGKQVTLLLKLSVSPVTKRKLTENDFDRMKVVGKGSFGTVYQVVKKDTGCLYAMKVLHKKNIIERNAVRHAIAERTVLKNIHHPFLVHLKYAFQTPERLFMVIDYLNGGELFYHLQKDDAFGEERAKFYAAEIVLALGYLHDNDILYRDLKPENILLDMEGHVCIVDFGLCKTGLGVNAKTSTFCGSLEYMAPEVLAGEPYQSDIDWWALATMVYEMIEGIPPFWDEEPEIMVDQISQCDLTGKFNEKFSTECVDFVSRILKLSPERRLGRGSSGTEDIKSHPWFASIDWIKLYNREIDPPFKPHVKDEFDTSYFDEEVTAEDPNKEFSNPKKKLPQQLGLDEDPFGDFSFEEDMLVSPSSANQTSRRRRTNMKSIKVSKYKSATRPTEKSERHEKSPRKEKSQGPISPPVSPQAPRDIGVPVPKPHKKLDKTSVPSKDKIKSHQKAQSDHISHISEHHVKHHDGKSDHVGTGPDPGDHVTTKNTKNDQQDHPGSDSTSTTHRENGVDGHSSTLSHRKSSSKQRKLTAGSAPVTPYKETKVQSHSEVANPPPAPSTENGHSTDSVPTTSVRKLSHGPKLSRKLEVPSLKPGRHKRSLSGSAAELGDSPKSSEKTRSEKPDGRKMRHAKSFNVKLESSTFNNSQDKQNCIVS